MTITAKIITDSFNEPSGRITTFQLRYPRFIHAELMTHRVFSRNASSSRAIPVERLIADIIADTAIPIHWGRNIPGMQADEENDSPLVFNADGSGATWQCSAQEGWEEARDRAIEAARAFSTAGYHKQIVNRLLEPFSHINVVVTATNFDNFYWLRRHKDAQPEIKVLADVMYDAHMESEPEQLEVGQWHLPYIRPSERHSTPAGDVLEDLIAVSLARCARVSYLTHDGRETTFAEDIALTERLIGSTPLHASPAEHQATPDVLVSSCADILPDMWAEGHLSGNFDEGWIQYRKTLPNEFCAKYGGSNG